MLSSEAKSDKIISSHLVFSSGSQSIVFVFLAFESRTEFGFHSKPHSSSIMMRSGVMK